jgi:formylmethanofuran dehydrogenase subunit B
MDRRQGRSDGKTMGAFVKGKAQPLQAALDRAAAILRASRLPLFCGMGADMAAGRAAIRLVEKLGGVVDHMHSPVQSRFTAAMQDAGMMYAMPSEARQRADVLVIAGQAAAAAPIADRIAKSRPDTCFVPNSKRTIIRLNTGGNARASALGIPGGSARLSSTLSVLSAILTGKPLASSVARSADGKALVEIATTLRAARFGTMVWSPRDMDAVTIELMGRIVEELNAKTRWTTVPVMEESNAAGIDQLMGWSSGFPVRTAFGRGFPEHDCWAHDTRRLVSSGEADAALWLSTFERKMPVLPRNMPLIAIVRSGTRFERHPDVAIETGVPGIDHDAEMFDPETMTIRAFPASRPSHAIVAAHVVSVLAERLEDRP